MDANRPAEGPLLDDNRQPANPLALPGNAGQTTSVQSVTLEQAVASAFRNNPSLRNGVTRSKPRPPGWHPNGHLLASQRVCRR